jgi:20S proteasome subunit beta 2
MAPNIYCCGAGTAADTEAVTGKVLRANDILMHFPALISFQCSLLLFPSDMVSSQLQLHRYATGRESRVVTALTLLKSHLFK